MKCGGVAGGGRRAENGGDDKCSGGAESDVKQQERSKKVRTSVSMGWSAVLGPSTAIQIMALGQSVTAEPN